jgi:TP901 family phage tail tape measure protein
MADEIKQELGFDAAQALQEIAKLNKAFGSMGAHLDELSGKLRAFNSGSSATENATAKLASAFNTNMGAAADATERLTTSAALISRILITQATVQGLRVLRTDFEAAAQEAAKFQTKIAEIQTIADGASFGQIAQSVRAVSDSLNVPLLEVAAAQYQSLSSNVGDFNQSLKLTESAAKLAKAGNSDVKSSVDLLAGAINSFHLSVDDADRVAGSFLATVKQGRVTIGDLANTFGRSGERAAALGISLDEVNAALATTTVAGLKSSEAVTFLNGIITGLTKPTDEMSAALAKFGFTSAEAAIATLGLPKLLQSLADSTDGTSASLAKLFPNIRGVSGELTLTGANFSKFARNLDAARNAGAAFAQDKFLTATATDANKVTSELNKLRNSLTVDFGASLLKAAADASQFVGGADAVIADVKTLTPLALAAGAALTAYAVGSRAAAAATALLKTELSPLSVALLAIGAASSIGHAIDNNFFGGALKGFQDLEAASKKSLDQFTQNEQEKTLAFDRANGERAKIALQNVAELNRGYLRDKENLAAANDALVSNTKVAANRIIDVRQKLVDELAKSADEARKLTSTSQLRVGDVQSQQNNNAFDRSISGLSESQQAFELTRRAAAQSEQASKAFKSAAQSGDEQAIQRAIAIFEEAKATNARAAEAVAKTDSIGQQFEVARQLEQIDAQRIESEKRLQRIQQDRIAALDQERDRQAGIVEQIRAATKILTENVSQFDKSGNLLPQDDLAKRQAARQKALADLVKLSLSDKDLTAEKALGLTDFVSRFQNELSDDPLRLKLTVEGESDKIKAQLTQSFDKFTVKLGFDTSALEQALGKKFQTPDDVSQGIIEARNKARQIEQQLSQSNVAGNAAGRVQQQLNVINGVIDQLKEDEKGDFSSVGKGFRVFADDFAAVSQSAKITSDDVHRLFNELNGVQESAQGFFGIGKRPFVLNQLEEIVQAIPKLQELQNLRTKVIEVPPDAIQQLKSINDFLKTIDPVTPFKSAAAAITDGATSAERIAASFERAGVAAERLGIQPSIATQAPRSVETAVQQQPGSTNFGDINVTVNGATGSAQQTARDFAVALRRELRRKSSTLEV